MREKDYWDIHRRLSAAVKGGVDVRESRNRLGLWLTGKGEMPGEYELTQAILRCREAGY